MKVKPLARNVSYRFLDAFRNCRLSIPAPEEDLESSVTAIVFSKDRPMQLDALLASMQRATGDLIPLHVVFVASDVAVKQGYDDVMNTAPSRVIFHDESPIGFKASLEAVLRRIDSRTVLFLVDDIVFIQAVDLLGLAALATQDLVPSLRLGRNIRWSYMQTRRQYQPLMKFYENCRSPDICEELWAWRWNSGDLDWGYMYSLDGNVFVTDTLRSLVADIDYTSPNTLELALQAQSAREPRPTWGLCFRSSRLVNLPLNRVQVDFDNVHGRVHQDRLIDLWSKGYRIDIDQLWEMATDSAHLEIDPPLVQMRSR